MRFAVVLVLALGIAACSSGGRRRLAAPPGGPRVLTVPQVERMVQTGTQAAVIVSEMQKSGTVYRLTTQQERDLRAVGVPPVLINQMELTYQRAVSKNPELATSGNYWLLIDGYWYGGLPVGWPRDWVSGSSGSAPVAR